MTYLHRLTDFPDLGVGVGLRPVHYPEFIEGHVPSSVSWVEVVTENFLPWLDRSRGFKSLEHLEKIRESLPVALHGVSLSLGSADGISSSYLTRLAALCDRIQPAWVSDHLCWTGIGGQNLHDLLPLPYTEESIQTVVSHIEQVQEALGRRVLIENLSSYVEFDHSEMTEWEFLTEIATRADCGILLDVNNVYVSAHNHGFDPLEYLRGLPAHRVGQIHLAGHTERGQMLVDTHDQPIRSEVWDLYRWTVRNLGPVSAMVERDGNIPEWQELEKELLILKSLRKGSDAQSFASPNTI